MAAKTWGLCPVCESTTTRDSGPCTRCRWYQAIGQLVRSALEQGSQVDQDAAVDVLREHAMQRQRFFTAMSQMQRTAVESALAPSTDADPATGDGRLF